MAEPVASPQPKVREGTTVVQQKTAVDPVTGKLWVRHPQLGMIQVSPEDAASIRDLGSVSESDAEAARYKQLRARAAYDPISAIATGVLKSAPGAVPALVEMDRAGWLGDETDLPMSEFLQTQEQESPGLVAAGELIGTGAQLATQFSIPGALARGSARIAGMGGPSIVGRALAGGVAGGAEMALYAPSIAANEAWINDQPYTLDSALAHTGGLTTMGAILGVGGGAIGGIAAKVLGRGAKTFGHSANAEMQVVKDAAPSTRDRLVAALSKGSPSAELVRDLRLQKPEIEALTLKEVREAKRYGEALAAKPKFDEALYAFDSAADVGAADHKLPAFRKLLGNTTPAQQAEIGIVFDKTLDEARKDIVNQANRLSTKLDGALQQMKPEDAQAARLMIERTQAEADLARLTIESRKHEIQAKKLLDADQKLGIDETLTRGALRLRKGSEDIATDIDLLESRASIKAEEYVKAQERIAEAEASGQATEMLYARASKLEAEGRKLQHQLDDARRRLDVSLKQAPEDMLAYQKRLQAAERFKTQRQANQLARDELQATRQQTQIAYEEATKRLATLKNAADVPLDKIPADLAGHTAAVRLLRDMSLAEGRVSALNGAEKAAQQAMELDILKKKLASNAKGGSFLGPSDDWADLYRKLHDYKFRTTLEDARVFGGLANYQKARNAKTHGVLNISGPVMRRLYRASAKDASFSTWVNGMEADERSILNLIEGSAMPEARQDIDDVMRYLKDTRDIARLDAPFLSDARAAKLSGAAKKIDELIVDIEKSFENEKVRQEIARLMGAGHPSNEPRIVGAIAGGTLGGPAGAAIGMGAGQAVINALQPGAAAARRAAIYQQRMQNDSLALRIAERIARGGKAPRPVGPEAAEAAGLKLAPEVKPTKPPTAPKSYKALVKDLYEGSHDEPDKQHEALLGKLQATATNRAYAEAGVRAVLGPTADDAPELLEHATAKAQAAAKILLDKAPNPSVSESDIIWGSRFSIPPNKAAMDNWARLVAASLNPNEGLVAVAEGNVTPELIEVLDATHPAYMVRFRAVTLQVAQSGDPPDRATRMRLGTLLGLQVDPALSPDFARVMAMLDAEQQAAVEKAQKTGDRRTFSETGVKKSYDSMSSHADQVARGIER